MQTEILDKQQIGSLCYTMLRSYTAQDGLSTVSVYGIGIESPDNTVIVEDISDDYCGIRNLFDLIVAEVLFPEHLYDVVEDYLS